MTAIRTEGLSKRYGSTLALDSLDLSIEAGEVYGYLGPNGAGQDDDDPRCCSGSTARAPGERSSSASTPGAIRWPPIAALRTSRASRSSGRALTGAETLDFLARLRGGDRRRLPRRPHRALPARHAQEGAGALEGQPPEGAARRRVRDPGRPADPRRADERARPAHGDRVPRDGAARPRQRGQTVFLSSHILSEVEALCDRVGILRDGRLVDRGDARRAAPPRCPDRRDHLRRACADPAACLPACTSLRPARTRCAAR